MEDPPKGFMMSLGYNSRGEQWKGGVSGHIKRGDERGGPAFGGEGNDWGSPPDVPWLGYPCPG